MRSESDGHEYLKLQSFSLNSIRGRPERQRESWASGGGLNLQDERQHVCRLFSVRGREDADYCSRVTSQRWTQILVRTCFCFCGWKIKSVLLVCLFGPVGPESPGLTLRQTSDPGWFSVRFIRFGRSSSTSTDPYHSKDLYIIFYVNCMIPPHRRREKLLTRSLMWVFNPQTSRCVSSSSLT